ncbi:CDP-glycerol glycerophosphotransferase, TagB/SpsB family [Luteibacter sp. UNC138MFCol5.1]|uniref:CDP-glycerol glycerophosphotransferase family protein n=1 Tax=Luteibacter sp. UNC138MFCol5.1 TaxID=1502774 RepID=UPI0008BD3DAB|nr:CDP-glycerol glycerophosphotransferase family protein [Luteibacter sp. UNC138MFCol5.1]SEO33725.1 CDP-glycerol glycerophosphotransferase, TagB/SpsB family [Luteibacter sp. UNC138MFCol5.1]
MFATETYALPILRPLAAAARARGIDVGWVVPAAMAASLTPDERRIRSLRDARAMKPEAVYCAANWVSPALPGIKVQVFHGFNAQKREPDRGHFAIRGFFDLYATQGPSTTAPFAELAREHGYFAVRETGWPKLDPLFGPAPAESDMPARDGRPIVMYASTFSHRLSSAPAMVEPLRAMIARGDRQWLLTLHPKCSDELFDAYRGLEAPNARFFTSERLVEMERAADVLVCDTSSVIHEFAVMGKPVVTIANRVPQPFMLDVPTPADVDAAIDRALSHPPELMAAIRAHGDDIHPYRDGRSSERVLDAVAAFQRGEFGTLKRKPLNLIRRFKALRDIGQLLDLR